MHPLYRWSLLAPIISLSLLIFCDEALGQPTPSSPPPSPAEPSASQGPTRPLPQRMTAPEFKLGSPKAKVTVVEYASDTCPHCAKFAAEVFPAFKKEYVDSGKVLYVFREFPTDPVELSAAGFVLARCAGEAKYFDVVDALFQAQTTSQTGLDFLMAGAKAGGLDENQLKACLNDPNAAKDLDARVQDAINVEKVDGTPAFIVNGKKMDPGEKSLKQLEDYLDPLLATTKGAQKRHKT